MSYEKELMERSGSVCELDESDVDLTSYLVPNSPTDGLEAHLLLCGTCLIQVQDPDRMSSNHWRCLNDSMWSPIDAAKVMSWRLLNILKSKGEMWASDLLDMMYMEDDLKAWAEAGDFGQEKIKHVDSNGNELKAGDNVVLVKTLNVKGSNISAKKGVVVKNIRLDPENAEHIEGRVEGQMIVILTQYVKKSG